MTTSSLLRHAPAVRPYKNHDVSPPQIAQTEKRHDMSDTLAINHEPYGLDGRYDARFEERRPRDPIGGDMVAVGFLTRPGGVAETVRLHWSRNGRPQTPVLARPVARGTDEDRWLVELGVLEAGDAVEYWMTAEGTGATVSSSRFGFVTRRWRRLAGVAAVEPVASGPHPLPMPNS